jgi:hypothetical protein
MPDDDGGVGESPIDTIQVILGNTDRGGCRSSGGPRLSKRLIGRIGGTTDRGERLDAERLDAESGDETRQSPTQI